MATTDQQSNSKKTSSISVYFLAAPEDEKQCTEIKKHLSPVIRSSKIPIEINSDFEIPPGEDINEYKLKLYEADIVLAFISADFINDDQTYIRTQKVIERYNNNETVMLPILVRNCMWKSTPFVNLPLLPKNTQPLNNKHFWNSEDDALTAVVSDIYESIKEFTYDEPVIEEPAKVEAVKVDQTVHVVEQVVEPAETKMAKETPIQPETIKSQPQPSKQKVASKKPPQAPLDVNWRKKYHRTTLWKRGFAFFLDQILTAIPAIIGAMILAFVLWPDLMESTGAKAVEDTYFTIGFALIIYFVICAIFESSKWRGTFGKRILKLEITNKLGERIGFFKAFWRNILRWLIAYSYLLIFAAIIPLGENFTYELYQILFAIPLVLQIITFIKYKKLFHDQISFTVVGEQIKR